MTDQKDYIVGYTDNQGNKHTNSVTATDARSAIDAVHDSVGLNQGIRVTSCLPTQQDDHTAKTDS